MDGFRGAEAGRLQVVLADDVQLLQQNMAAGVGGRFVHGIVAVIGGDGFLPAGGAVGQVGHRQQAALLVAEADDGGGDVPAIEGVPPLFGNDAQSAGQVGLAQDVAGAQRVAAAVAGEYVAAGGELAQQGIAGNGRRQVVGYGEAILGQGDGGRQGFGQGQAPVLAVDIQPGVEQARHGHAQNALHGDAAGVAFQGGGVGGGAGAVAHAQAVGGGVVGHNEAVAADAGHQGFHDAQGGGGGDGGVKGVAAALEDADAGLGGHGVAGAHHSVAPHNDRAVGGVADAVRRSGHRANSPVGSRWSFGQGGLRWRAAFLFRWFGRGTVFPGKLDSGLRRNDDIR